MESKQQRNNKLITLFNNFVSEFQDFISPKLLTPTHDLLKQDFTYNVVDNSSSLNTDKNTSTIKDDSHVQITLTYKDVRNSQLKFSTAFLEHNETDKYFNEIATVLQLTTMILKSKVRYFIYSFRIICITI